MLDNTYTIKTVSDLSGLTELVIRAWENRYDVVKPERSSGNRRLYNETDLEKLILLKKLTDKGFRIGNIASLSIDNLNQMLAKEQFEHLSDKQNGEEAIIPGNLRECLSAIRDFNSKKLEIILLEASVHLSQLDLVEKLLIPLMEKIGELWQDGVMRMSHEHFASTVIRKFLSNLSEGYNIDNNAPKMVITTPQGQYHEFGALVASAIATSEGWRIIYLGASLPAEEIAFVIKESGAKLLFLSIVYPNDDPSIISEANKLKEIINGTKVIVSGKSAEAYEKIFREKGFECVREIKEFRNKLRELRNL